MIQYYANWKDSFLISCDKCDYLCKFSSYSYDCLFLSTNIDMHLAVQTLSIRKRLCYTVIVQSVLSCRQCCCLFPGVIFLQIFFIVTQSKWKWFVWYDTYRGYVFGPISAFLSERRFGKLFSWKPRHLRKEQLWERKTLLTVTFVVLIVWNFTPDLQGVRFWKRIIFLFDALFSTDKEVILNVSVGYTSVNWLKEWHFNWHGFSCEISMKRQSISYI